MMTIDQQQSYVWQCQSMWMRVARIHGHASPQEIALFKVYRAQIEILTKMQEKNNG